MAEQAIISGNKYGFLLAIKFIRKDRHNFWLFKCDCGKEKIIRTDGVYSGAVVSCIQTDGTQKTQIVDAGGEQVTVTGGKLDVNASVDTTGLALEAGNLAKNSLLKGN